MNEGQTFGNKLLAFQMRLTFFLIMDIYFSYFFVLVIWLLKVPIGFLHMIAQIYFDGLHLEPSKMFMVFSLWSNRAMIMWPLIIAVSKLESTSWTFRFSHWEEAGPSLHARAKCYQGGLYTVVLCSSISPSKHHLLENFFSSRCNQVELFRGFLFCWPWEGLVM